MRNTEIVKSRVSPLRLVTAFLLAGAASGCSSDVTRFDGLFSSKTDGLTTNSIPHKVNAVNGKLPTPREDIANAGNNQDLSGDAALDQPYPGRNTANAGYDPISTSTTELSPARASVNPIRVQRTELSTPTVRAEEKVALNQALPGKIRVEADPISTGTIKGRWIVSDRSPRIVIRSGETLSGISARYGVPQAEILRANKLETAADLKYGKSLLIPVAAKVDLKAKGVPVELAAEGKKKVPVPGKLPEQDKAILPTASARDKAKSADKVADNAENGGLYVVKQGDSLARIARNHKVSIDALKQANGMNTASVRIGQSIKIPVPGADNVKTASIPADSKVKETAEAKPKTYTPPVAEKSVAEVQKSADNGEDAPDATGIGKYRWPVRGAVIAGYGQNVEGTRNAGIDISVPEGTAVKAAENGVVIYSGSGLKDLGNTVLVRHDDGTVTVYGNAASLGVKRGDKVTRGQVIANSGMTGAAKRPKLHFEVRKNAVAVNPMTFLQ
ncbi:peptidoglycan DD-metalloendopeptidase family protein [Rhizobium sp. KVB221]|uniref:Peptidoglycan DD-metalloendopeptidase family protein n=1 Tax=Rhizobium setariae TaxID=2801340 RepID=A0A936YVU9_9HYPH|nr:M23 family metallopeptidase [Rhizobium setariae]MBL0374881.1 peptidoglycan DD-metalloendopeptidase family protein [Rhizobium setariae]